MNNLNEICDEDFLEQIFPVFVEYRKNVFKEFFLDSDSITTPNNLIEYYIHMGRQLGKTTELIQYVKDFLNTHPDENCGICCANKDMYNFIIKRDMFLKKNLKRLFYVGLKEYLDKKDKEFKKMVIFVDNAAIDKYIFDTFMVKK